MWEGKPGSCSRSIFRSYLSPDHASCTRLFMSAARHLLPRHEPDVQSLKKQNWTENGDEKGSLASLGNVVQGGEVREVVYKKIKSVSMLKVSDKHVQN